MARDASAGGGRDRYMGDRIVRVEALIEQLTKQVDKTKENATQQTPSHQLGGSEAHRSGITPNHNDARGNPGRRQPSSHLSDVSYLALITAWLRY